ncbi:unnamed protein product [Sphagnum tenellum]
MEAPDAIYQPTRLSDAFDLVQATANDVWKLWMQNYLPTLLTRSKWRFQEKNLAVHDVVLVIDEALPGMNGKSGGSSKFIQE